MILDFIASNISSSILKPWLKFDGLISKAKCRGFDISIEDSKHLADSLDKAVIEDDPYFNKLLRILSTRCMVRTSWMLIYYYF